MQALFSLQPVSCFKQEFYIFDSPFYHRTNYFLFFRLRDIKYFSCAITLLLRCKETKSSPLCKSSVKFAAKPKSLTSNNQASPTYWPLKNTFFTLYKRDSPTFKLLNCLDRISYWVIRNIWSIRFLKKWIKNIKIRFVFCFSRKSKNNFRGTDFFLILLSYYLPPC